MLVLEFDRRYLLGAVHEIARDRKTENMNIVQAPAVPLNKPEGYKLLLASVHEFAPKDDSELLVVIDHESACFAGKENEDDPNRKWIQNLDAVAANYPVSFLVVCQAPKEWRGDIVDLPIGSRILTAWADTVVSIRRKGRATRTLEVVSNYGEVEPITYTKEFQVVPTEQIEETKRETAMAIIKERWHEFKYPNITKKVEEIVKTLGFSPKTVWDAYRAVKLLKKAAGTQIPLDARDAEETRQAEK